MSSPAFEWRELVYCEICNPTRRLERACAGAVTRHGGVERAVCAECVRRIQAMGYANLHAPECACGATLLSRYTLRQVLSVAIEKHLAERTPAAAYALLRASVLLQQCDSCATTTIETNALVLAGELLEPRKNGGEHGR